MATPTSMTGLPYCGATLACEGHAVTPPITLCHCRRGRRGSHWEAYQIRWDERNACMTTVDPCAQEPIHVPGAIQPHGALVCVADDGRVLHRSANVDDILATTLPLGAPLPPELAKPGTLRQDAGSLYVSAHHTAQGVLLEFESLADAGQQTPDEAYLTLRRFIDGIEPRSGVRDVGQAAARQIRAMTGFNRTLLYR